MGCESDSSSKSPDTKRPAHENKCTDEKEETPDPWKRPCKPVKKVSGDTACHSSHEQFKKKDECKKTSIDECPQEQFKKKPSVDDECHGSQKEFRQKENECHESTRKQICPSVEKKMDRDICHEGEEDRCCPKQESTTSRSDCREDKPRSARRVAAESSSCASSKSAYSKISRFCKDLAKDYVKLKPKSKFSDAAASLEDTFKRPTHLPPSQPPCSPLAEGTTKSPASPSSSCCDKGGKAICPDIKKPSLADFFPLDARNKQLKECIEKYMKLDPNEVINRCSQFATTTSKLSEKCLKTMKQSQQQCMQTVRSSKAVKRTSMMVPGRTLQLAGRWAPTAAVYLATTAIFTVYVTEWKVVLRYVPFYSHLAEQEAPS